MILTCPECSARFAVPDALIPPEGRTVKCGRCAYQWHADGLPADLHEEAASFAELAAAAQEEAAPVAPRQLPVPQRAPLKPTPFIIGTAAFAVVWLILGFMAYYPGWMQVPGLRNIYRNLGITTTEGLVFENVSMQRQKMETKTQFLITGSIANHAAENRMVPTVRVQLKNEDGEAVWEREYEVNEPLAPGEPYAFRIDNVETSFADSVVTIALDLGHPLQLMMR